MSGCGAANVSSTTVVWLRTIAFLAARFDHSLGRCVDGCSMAGTDRAHEENVSANEFDTLDRRQDSRLGHPQTIFEGERLSSDVG